MGNIKNYNFNKLDLRLSNSDYWDFYLNSDENNSCGIDNECNSVVFFDFNDDSIYDDGPNSGDTIYSLTSWAKAVNSGYTLNTIGLTGIDNGLVSFDKLSGDTTNQALLSAITGSTLYIPSGETRFMMTRVTGSTNTLIYPIEKISGMTSYVQFCGGFYQGFYKLDGYDYEVLPNRVNQTWSTEIWLNKQDICNYTGTTLNDLYPDNKGFFFYMGTRAENKFWSIWEGANTGCTSGCTIPSGCTDTLTEWCTIPKENEIYIVGDYGVRIPLSPPNLNIELITNPFLLYGRAENNSYNLSTASTGSFIYNNDVNIISNTCSVCGGNSDGLGSRLACTCNKEGIVVVKQSEKISNTENPFLIYGRATGNNCRCYSCSGDNVAQDTVCTFSGFTTPIIELDYKVDVIDNALGFRVKDDGSIGYRLLTYTGQCDSNNTYVSGVTIEEGYSEPNIIKDGEWSYVVIKFKTCTNLDDCELLTSKPRKGRLSFYVNTKLVYYVDNFDEFIAKRLNEYKDKQIGVPFNFSLGGGSQGLIESQTFDGYDINDKDLLIENYFAGSFIGGIQNFKFNICDLKYSNIVDNYKLGMNTVNTTIIKSPSGYYYGKLTGQTFDLSLINLLDFTLGDEIINNYVTFSSDTNSYGYILIPTDFTQPTNMKNSNLGCQGFDVPYIQLDNVNILDNNGFVIEYSVYRTYNKSNGEFDIWFCE